MPKKATLVALSLVLGAPWQQTERRYDTQTNGTQHSDTQRNDT